MKTRAALLVLVGLSACVLSADPQPGPMGDAGPKGDMGDPGPVGVSPFTYVDAKMTDIYYEAGYVGIGTAAPQSKLNVFAEPIDFSVPSHSEVGGTIGNRILVHGQEPGLMLSSNAGQAGVETNLLGLQIGQFGGNVRNQILYGGAPLYVTEATPNGSALNVRMIVDTAGRVGVGTTTPAAALEIGQNPERAIQTAYFMISGGNVPADDRPYIRGGLDHIVLAPAANNGQKNRVFLAYPTDMQPGTTVETHIQETIFIAPTDSAGNGNVGIGTTTPTAMLDVHGNSATEAVYLSNAGGGPALHVSSAGMTVDGNTFLAMTPGARVGIGTDAPTAALQVAGTVHATTVVTQTGCCAPSDARLKKNIKQIDASALSRLLRLRGVTYEWKEPEKHGDLRGRQIGMIAQEVEQVFPDWVGTSGDGHKTLTYRGFEALAVESFRELKIENDRLKAENGQLAGKLAAVEERLAALEKRSGVQHASVFGDGRWLGGAMVGVAIALAPWWMRRRRRGEEAVR